VSSDAAGEPVSVGGVLDATGPGQRGQPLVEGRVTDAALVAQFVDGQGAGGIEQCRGDAFINASGCWRRFGRGLGWTQSERVTVGVQLEREARWRSRGAMFDRKAQAVGDTAQVQIGVAPGVELGGAAKRLAGA
jgi:hypothetical protein